MVETGLAVLLRSQLHLLRHKRVGLVTHEAAVTSDLRSSIDALLAGSIQIQSLFSGEHGIYGVVPDGIHITHDVYRQTGIPVFSLYGEHREPTEEMLAQVEILVFDFQDIGARFYTFGSTLYYLLKSAAEYGKPVILLDRPNPLGGLSIEGPALEPGCESFVGVMPGLPIRHAMTIGELGLYMNSECHFGADLEVIALLGWKRSDWFEDTGLPWTPTSPAMPHLSTTIVYPGMCLLEGTNISEGRGTTLPFEICGAPWIDAYTLADGLNKLDLPGARFRPVHFTPSASKYAGVGCHGIQIHVTDRHDFRPVLTGVAIIQAVKYNYANQFAWKDSFDRLAGAAWVRQAIDQEIPLSEIQASLDKSTSTYIQKRAPYLLYA